MTYTESIPLSDIDRLQIYVGNHKNTMDGMKAVMQKTGGDIVMSAAIFLRTLKPCCHLKVDGETLCKPADYSAWAISWNTSADFAVRVAPCDYANYMACVKCIINGNKVDMDYQQDMKYPCNRLAVGSNSGYFTYYATEDNLSPEQLQERLYEIGWNNAIMMDGGGTVCILFSDGTGFSGDGRIVPIWLVVHLKNTQDGNDMETINVYSKAKDGMKKPYMRNGERCTNFTVKEFSCQDGSDPVFVAPALVTILQEVRSHFGKAVTLNSAYRTPTHNKKIGGSTYSQHMNGTAADIVVKGISPKMVAAYVETLIPQKGGIGIYKNFTHIDVRKTRSRWNG